MTASLPPAARRLLRVIPVVLLPLAAGACRRADDARAETARSQPQLVGPENVTVVRAEAIRTGPALSGSLAAERSATIRAEMSGAVVQTYAEAGQRVAAGQPLAQIDAAVLRDQEAGARSAVATASNASEVARRNLARAEALEKAGAIALRDLEQSRSAALAAATQLSAARAQWATVQKQLSRATVRAPFAGVVAMRQVSAGDVVSPGAALFTVVDPATMRLEASVPAEALGQVRLGMPVEFSVTGYPGRTFSGRITRVSPVADPATRQVRLVADIPNAGNALVAGLFAQGRVSSESRIAPMVPRAAVDESGLRPSVVRLRRGVIEKVDVQLGLRDQAAETVEIRSGVSAGDTLLLGAARGITPGTPVRVSAPADVRT